MLRWCSCFLRPKTHPCSPKLVTGSGKTVVALQASASLHSPAPQPAFSTESSGMQIGGEGAEPAATSPSRPGLTPEDARLRWAVHTRDWKPWDEEWLFLLDLLPHEDQKEVESFKFKADQQRALLSRLAQRACVSAALGIPHDKVVIKRTKARKPFAVCSSAAKAHAPNFNFNVSHEGDYVVLATEPVCIVGVDVAAPHKVRSRSPTPGGSPIRKPATIDTLQKTFSRQITPKEWEVIRSAGPSEKAMEDQFRRHWSLKEAFVKARGDGLGFDLSKAQFEMGGLGSSTASVLISGVPQPRWRFFLEGLEDGHWVAVARGHPSDIVDEWQVFTKSLNDKCTDPEAFQRELDAPSPPFKLLGVRDLVPQGLLADYLDATGSG